MPRFDPAEFSRMLARLTPQELRRAEGLVADARKRAEAVLEIDARADAGGPVGSDQNRRTAMELLGVRRDVVGPERHAAGPGPSPRPGGRAGA
jgi:hypothetical protein